MKDLAAHRKNRLPDEFPFDDPAVLKQVLPPGALQRWLEWAEQKLEKQSLGGHFLADLDHHPNTKSAGGPLFPTQATHCSAFSWHKKRLATKMECFAAHGLHVFPHLAGTGQKYMADSLGILKTLKPVEQAHLVGNALFSPIVACWAAYCLSSIAPKELGRQVRWPEPEALPTIASTTAGGGTSCRSGRFAASWGRTSRESG